MPRTHGEAQGSPSARYCGNREIQKGEGVAMMAWKDESFQMSQLCVCLALSVAASRETTPFGSLAY